MGKLHETQIYIDEAGALTALEVRARARRPKRQYSKLGLIVIDYLQLMVATAQGENRATEISEISRSLKAMAKELDVPVVALSQLNRALEQRPNKRPQMADLRESGAIEQDAHVPRPAHQVRELPGRRLVLVTGRTRWRTRRSRNNRRTP